jgi:hypothetical protein
MTLFAGCKDLFLGERIAAYEPHQLILHGNSRFTDVDQTSPPEIIIPFSTVLLQGMPIRHILITATFR